MCVVNSNSKDQNERRPRKRSTKHDNSGDENNPPANLAEAIRARFAPLGGIELELPPREPMREPPEFE
ncbi:MAG: plasmid stabilization protein [Gemmatimonadetes bacterium]|nr:plasmid stabilization protein [Gemmatimonadota bacterium]